MKRDDERGRGGGEKREIRIKRGHQRVRSADRRKHMLMLCSVADYEKQFRHEQRDCAQET